MENINNFLVSAQSYGVPVHSLFQTVDLYDDKNMVQVIDAIHALGGVAQKNKFDGPVCGVKHAEKNVYVRASDHLLASRACPAFTCLVSCAFLTSFHSARAVSCLRLRCD